MIDIHQYDDVDFDSALETDHAIKAGAPVDPNDVVRLSDLTSLGSIVTGNYDVITSLRYGGEWGLLQYRYRTLSATFGLITNISAESGWVDVDLHPPTSAPPTTAPPTSIVPTT